MAGWVKLREHIWCDQHGTPILRHTKYQTANGVAFPWQHRVDFGNGIARWFQGDGKDYGITHPLLYPRDVFARARSDEHCWITEGERDADSLIGVGVLAVTAGGVFSFTREHARLFRGWRGLVTIVRDNDLPGAYGAARTYGALLQGGMPQERLRIARGRCKSEGSDAHDHLSAGYTVKQLISEPIAKVRKLAALATPESFSRAGYGGWAVVTAEEAAQLKGWKPVAS